MISICETCEVGIDAKLEITVSLGAPDKVLPFSTKAKPETEAPDPFWVKVTCQRLSEVRVTFFRAGKIS